MGFFSGYRTITSANNILKRIESCTDMLEYHLNAGNFAHARTYCNDAASHVREFLETVEQDHIAENAVYFFKGRKFTVLQLALLFNEALNSANAIIIHNGY